MSHGRAKAGPVGPRRDRRPSPTLVKDERHLTALYLLTVADIRGTSPKVWNAWKAKLLEDLYRITLRVLGGEPHSADRELKNRQEEALATLRLFGLPRRRARGAVEAARRGLLPAPRRLRHRLADARAVRPHRQRQAGGQVPPGADRRRPAGGRVRQGPARPVRAHLQLFRPQELQHPRRQDPHHAARLRARHLPGHRAELRQELPRHHQPDRARTVRAADDRRRRCRRPRAGACRACRAPSRSRRRSTCGPTNAASTTCCRSRPTTAPACCTRSPTCSRATASTCTPPRS